jgi:RNA polymerase sigma-B factor
MPTRKKSNQHKNGGEVKQYFYELRKTGNQEIREKLVNRYMSLAHFFARRFSAQPEYQDDLHQVATLGLIHAIDRFDPDRGVEFITFATITVLGEIKRYFRDKTWNLKVPRRIKDLNILINHTIEKLSKEQDHPPTYSEIASAISVSLEQVLETREATQSYHVVSLDKEIESDISESSTTLMDLIGSVDQQIDILGERLSLQAGLKKLKEQERFVIYHRFFSNLSQAQIAKIMNVSQMQVSRLQTQALKKLKRIMVK